MPDPTPEATAPKAAAGAAPGGMGANAQVIDAVTAAHTLLVGGAPPTSFSMLDLALTQTLSTAMQTMVQRQQEAATLASAAVNAACARIAAAGRAMPGSAPFAAPPFPTDPAAVIAAATAQAGAAIAVLRTLQAAGGADAQQAASALARIVAEAATPSPTPSPPAPPPPAPAAKDKE